MADMDQVQVVRQGRDAVASWREEHPGVTMDLYNSYMSHVRIPMVDLSGADLRESDFMGAMLRRANLSGCYLNPVHFYRADLREIDLTGTLMNRANLRGADLRGANLEGADMDSAILSGANLTGANLSGANLSRVNLDRANLTDANLTDTVFHGAALTRADLSGATLEGADFYSAIFNDCPTVGTKFSGSIVGYTVFQNCDLSQAEGLDEIRHDAPSTLGTDSLIRSEGQLPESFMRGVGASDALIKFQKTISSNDPLSGEVFISCADSDISFGETLQNGLRQLGIRCWVFSQKSRGNALVDRRSTSEEEEIERWVRHYEKLIVVGSAVGMDTEAIRTDITQATERQKSNDEWSLYLVAPDSTLVQPQGRAMRNLTDEHIIYDLQGHAEGSEEYSGELNRLAEDLKQRLPAKSGVPVVSDEASNQL